MGTQTGFQARRSRNISLLPSFSSARIAGPALPLFLGFCAWGCAGLGALAATEASAQEVSSRVTRSVDTLPSCRDCTITFSPVLTRGRRDDAILLQGQPEVARLSDGALVAFATNRGGTEVMVYPVEGGPVWQLGGLGEGPGEYRFAQGIAVGANDSIYLTHDRRSVNVYAPDGRFARSIRSPENLSGPVVPREDGALVVVGGKIDGKPLHVIRETGLIETSFQAEGVILYGPVFDQERVVTPGASGTLWVAERRNYRFQRLSPDGVLERTIGIQPPDSWHSGLFMSMAERDSVTKAGETIRLTGNGPQKQKLAPFFAITGMYEAPDGLLWVSSIVARDGWEDVELKYDRRAFNTLFMNDIVDEVRVKLYRTVVDVIDPETGAVEARAEIDGIGQILNDGTFARTSPTALGVIQIEVFALEVNR